MRGAGYGMRDTGCGMRDAGYEMRDARYGMRGAGCEVRDARCGIAAETFPPVIILLCKIIFPLRFKALLSLCASLTSCRDAGLVKD